MGSGNLLASPPRARYYLRLMNEVTQLLSTLGQGDPHAASRLLPVVYDALPTLESAPRNAMAVEPPSLPAAEGSPPFGFPILRMDVIGRGTLLGPMHRVDDGRAEPYTNRQSSRGPDCSRSFPLASSHSPAPL